jgi:hypothetical protein
MVVPNVPAPITTADTADELSTLDIKLKQLRFEYEQYFIGSRPREPVLLRGDVNKIVVKYSNTGIQNTALRFKFNNLCARFFDAASGTGAPQDRGGTYSARLQGGSERRRSGGDGPSASAVRANETTEGGTDLFGPSARRRANAARTSGRAREARLVIAKARRHPREDGLRPRALPRRREAARRSSATPVKKA